MHIHIGTHMFHVLSLSPSIHMMFLYRLISNSVCIYALTALPCSPLFLPRPRARAGGRGRGLRRGVGVAPHTVPAVPGLPAWFHFGGWAFHAACSYTNFCACMCVYIYRYVGMFACMYVCMHLFMQSSAQVLVCSFTCTCVCLFTHAFTLDFFVSFQKLRYGGPETRGPLLDVTLHSCWGWAAYGVRGLHFLREIHVLSVLGHPSTASD